VPARARGRILKFWARFLLIGLLLVNFACFETQFPNYPTFPWLVLNA
jgi:hypothetical protein